MLLYRKRRLELKLTHEDLARKAGVKVSSVHRMEWEGKTTPAERLAVARVLRIPVKRLFEEVG